MSKNRGQAPAFARRDLIVPPQVGDRVRVVTTDGAALDGYWLGQTELPAGEGPVIEATVFTTQGAIETRRASITTLLDESSCRVEGEPNPETVRLLVGQLAYVGEAARKADERFQARIDSIVEEAHQEARDRDWCTEFDDFMERMGLPRKRAIFNRCNEVGPVRQGRPNQVPLRKGG